MCLLFGICELGCGGKKTNHEYGKMVVQCHAL